MGDVVSVSTPLLGTLINRVDHSNRLARWDFGVTALMRSLARPAAHGRDRKFEAEPGSGPSERPPRWPTAAVGVHCERAVPATSWHT